MAEIVSCLPICVPQNSLELIDRNDAEGIGDSMLDIIEEAVIKYLRIIEKREKPKRIKKRKENICGKKGKKSN